MSLFQHSVHDPFNATPISTTFSINVALQWRHNEHDGISNHKSHDCLLQCMKWPVTHSPNSTWFWLELVGNCCERLKIIMKYTNIQFCERLGHGWQFHPLYSTIYSGADQKKTSKLHVTGFCEGNSPVTGEFPAQRASNAENIPIWWCHHVHDMMMHWPFKEQDFITDIHLSLITLLALCEGNPLDFPHKGPVM